MAVILFLAIFAVASAGAWARAENLVFQLGLPTNRDGENFYDGSYSFDFYSDLTPVGSSVTWSVQSTDGGPKLAVQGSNRAEENNCSCWVRLDPDVQYTANTAYHYKLSAEFQDGSITSKEFTMSFVNDLPEEDTCFIVTPVDASTSPVTFGEPVTRENGSIDLVAGEVYAVSFHAETNNYFRSYGCYGEGWNGNKGWEEIDPYAEGNEEWRNIGLDSTQRLYRAASPGIYSHEYMLGYDESNLRRGVPFRLNVYDENGVLPQLVPEMSGDYTWREGLSDEVLDCTIYLGLPLDAASGVWNNSEIVAIYLDNRTLLENTYGGSPEWSMETVTTSGTGTLDLGNLVPNLNGVRASLKSMPTEPMEVEITVKCTWGNVTGSKKIRVHVKNPTFTMPDGLANLPDVIQTKVGETITIDPQISPSGWSLPGYEGRYYTRHGLASFASRDWNNPEPPTYIVNRAGTFTEIIEIEYGALSVSKVVTFEVAEAVDAQIVLGDQLVIDKILCGLISKTDPEDPDRVGTLEIVGNVKGPSNVVGVWVAYWWSTEPTAAEAVSIAQDTVSRWKSGGPYPEETVPYRMSIDRPVYNYEMGTTQYTLLVGLDTNIDMVGYAVVKTAIPGQNKQWKIQMSVSPETPVLGQEVTIRWEISGPGNFDGSYMDVVLYSGDMYKFVDQPYSASIKSKTGSLTFTPTEGEAIEAYIQLWAGGQQVSTETGLIPLSGTWNSPDPITGNVSYQVGQDHSITATYQITGGAGAYTSIYGEWVRFEADGKAHWMHNRELDSASSGQMVYAPPSDGEYALVFFVMDQDGWYARQDPESVTQTVTVSGIIPETPAIDFYDGLPSSISPDQMLDIRWDVTGGGESGDRETDVYVGTNDGIRLGNGNGRGCTNRWTFSLAYISDQSSSIIITLTPRVGTVTGETVTRVIPIIRGRLLVLPEDLTTIEAEAFLNVGASEISIPDGVEFIGQNAFPAGVTLIVGEGTYAESWARQNGYTPVVR